MLPVQHVSLRPAIGAVIFDMDGTLLDSEPVWERVRRGLVQELGGHWDDGTQTLLMGMSTAEWAQHLTTETGVALPAEAFAQLAIQRVGEAYQADLPLLPGAVEAVRRAGARWPLAVASSSPMPVVRLVLERAGIASLFAAVTVSDEVPRGKPAPDVYLLAAQRLGVAPAACLAVEDSSNGLRSAAAAGMRVVAVPRPEFPPAPDALALASVVVTDLGHLDFDRP